MDPNKVHEVIGKHVLIDEDSHVVDLKKSHGSWFVDLRNGKKYLDLFSQFASQALSWGHPKFIAQKERLAEASLFKLANPDMLSEEYSSFVEQFASITTDFKYHFYIEGGSAANENAIKIACDWKMQKLGWSEDKTNELDILNLSEQFSGRGGYSLSLTNRKWDDTKTKYFPKFNWTRILNPKCHFDKDGNIDNNIQRDEEISLEMAENALKKGNVALILLESYCMAEGGDGWLRYEYMKSLRELANKYEALLCFDEIQTGIGLTGKMWAYQHHNDVIPDILTFGKKMGVCGVCSTERVDEIKNNVFHVHSRINSTFGGNYTDMVRANIILNIIKEDNLIENAKVVGDYLLNKLRELDLENLRGKGLMLAFDLRNTEDRNKFLHKSKEKMIILPCGEKSIRLRPHLDFSKESADIACKFIKSTLL